MRGLGRLGRLREVRQVGVRAARAEMWDEWDEWEVSRPKNGLQLFCQFNLCFSFSKLSIVSKNSSTTSV